MCRRVDCPQCHKPTYAGCGMHIEQVLGDVPRADRCTCREKAKAEKASSAGAQDPSLFKRLFGSR